MKTIHSVVYSKGIPRDDKLDMHDGGQEIKVNAQCFENVKKQFLYSGHYVSMMAVN